MTLIALTLIATPAAQAHPSTSGATPEGGRVYRDSSSGAALMAISVKTEAVRGERSSAPDSNSAPGDMTAPESGDLDEMLRSRTSGDVSVSVTLAAPGAVQLTRCRSHRRGLIYYRLRANAWLALRGIHREVNLSQPHGCAHALWAAKRYRAKARIARLAYYAWQEAQWVLREQRTWRQAVEHVQKVFPGTSGWLMSCSAAEGGWGRWVGYGGQSYSTGLRDSDTVGGPMQFRFSTFTGMYRRAYDHLMQAGFRLSHEWHNDLTAAWRSPLGQALAGGWARWSGNDNSHWSASWSNGCR